MITKHLSILLLLSLVTLTSRAQATEGVNGEFSVDIGPVNLGQVVMSSTCKDSTCFYKSRAYGAFLFIKANVIELGSYQELDGQIVPLSSNYSERIGSDREAYTYNFSSLEITDQDSKAKVSELDKNAYPFIPLLNQVTLDLAHGVLKKSYQYVLKEKVKDVEVDSYSTTQTDKGMLHRITVKNKNREMEFLFVNNGQKLQFEEFNYRGFKMSRIK
ncbi:hypothetical protein [Vibrio diazotrophicus]|jgi:hypothetical protein|uniref:Outer membrane lipoprotein-sorting protein n=1 Tax=Vibrio diazotrophicus TaxID=685 RepID=A0A2J8HCH7_VIBDI|nr:hypothetical protein [Vibrio diazotrophicus]PNH82019.1 hypothetical protein C1N27_04810 [Vibrio diazotrophicus]PNH95985.1 hypothetical protein C1O24_12060 [Vibrio diazotrophicus]PNI03431.1 hypothetical protein C1N32_16365 [Vibrio diazotrophicus]